MTAPLDTPAFQARVKPWLLACFGEAIANDREERNHRFLEEALELVQALGCTASEAHQLVDYVFGRPIGEPAQEVGGVMVTLAALCLASGLDMHDAGEVELARIWTKVEKIRAKQAAKPKHSPLPEALAARAVSIPDAGAEDMTDVTDAMVDAARNADYEESTNGDYDTPEQERWRFILRAALAVMPRRDERAARGACADGSIVHDLKPSPKGGWQGTVDGVGLLFWPKDGLRITGEESPLDLVLAEGTPFPDQGEQDGWRRFDDAVRVAEDELAKWGGRRASTTQARKIVIDIGETLGVQLPAGAKP